MSLQLIATIIGGVFWVYLVTNFIIATKKSKKKKKNFVFFF